MVAVYTLVALGHLAALEFGWTVGEWMTKALLTVVLAGYVLLRRPVRSGTLLLAGLGCACAGDLAPQVDSPTTFGVGVVFFGAMQVLYLWVLGRLGAVRRLRGHPWIPFAYAVAFGVLMVSLLPQAGAALAIPLGLYGALLVTTAAVAAGLGPLTGLGGLLFVVSDIAIALRVLAGVDTPGWLVMATYAAAQLLLVVGMTGHGAKPAALNQTGPDQTGPDQTALNQTGPPGDVTATR